MSNLEGINFYGDWTVEDTVNYNIVNYIRYGLLEIGAYRNIDKGQRNYLGIDISKLTPVTGVTGIVDYTIYKGIKSDWIWETNITLKYTGGTQPYVPSGIYVNNVFFPTGSSVGGSGYILDFSRGQVIFGNPLGPTGIVQVAHAIRAVSVYTTDAPEYSELAIDWNRNANNSSGINNIQYKSYLPAIFVEVNNYDTIKGVQLGSREKLSSFNLDFFCLSTNSYEVKKLSSILYFLEEKWIPIYDLSTATWPLNTRGELVQPSSTWPILTRNTSMAGRFQGNARVSKVPIANPLFARRVTISMETETFPN